MTPEQRTALLSACEEGNEVRIITIALQIAAKAARDGKQAVAVALRDLVDAHHRIGEAEKLYRAKRETIAAMILANNSDDWTVQEAVQCADRLILANATMPIPEDTRPAATVPR